MRPEIAMPEAFDWRTMPFDGRVLIEASAGTGKTWSIGMLYLRLLLETGLGVECILVTTFTVAAAQELRERLRRRLAEAEHWLQCPAATLERKALSSPFVAYLAAHRRDDEAAALALRRVRLARVDLDRAPIATIHALCQRIGRDHPLESGAGFGDETLVADEDLRRECAEDFWRNRYLAAAVDADEECLFREGPEGLLRDLGTIAASGDAWDAPDGLADLRRRQAALADPAKIDRLRELAADRTLYAPRKTALPKRLASIADALAGEGDPWPAVAGALDSTFEAEAIDDQQSDSASQRLRDDPLIRELQALREPMSLHAIFVRGRVLADAARACRDDVPRRAARHGVATFAMLIDRIHARLSDPLAGPLLADRLFDAFPIALVDEFQDTDARQYAIFDRIYRSADGVPRGTLVMIGDPKQAIYGFRGGDIGAYLHASRQVRRRYSLATNQRSSAALVAALNGLYGERGGFGNAGIDYRIVGAAGRADERPYCVGADVVREPFVLHLFRGDAIDDKGEPERRVSILHERALDDCANDIAARLDDPQRTIDGKRLAPGDIAVLVPTNKDAIALRRRLRERGVPCAGGGNGSVFESDAADDVELLLHAVLGAEDERAVRGALTTRLLGADLAAVRRWAEQPASFERELERFAEWRALANARGVLALLGAVLESRAAALLAGADGERMLTDLRHLGELLAAEEPRRQGLEGLLAWYATIRREGDGESAADARRLRIESDAGRVQLATIHASKGLEYPVVYLPLAWKVQDVSGPRMPKVLRYRDDDGRLHIDLGSVDFIAHRARHFSDGLDERLRLLYVAMTRAVHALHVYWVDRDCMPATGVVDAAEAWKVPAIDVVLEAALRRSAIAGGVGIEDDVRLLAQRLPGIVAVGPFDGVAARYDARLLATRMRVVQTPMPAVRAFEWQHSFSSIARGIVADARHDGGAADEAGADAQPDHGMVAVEDSRILALQSLRGPRFGDAVHELFEKAQGPLWPRQRDLIAKTLDAHGLRVAIDDGDPYARVGELVDRCRAADLGDGLRLDAVERHVAEFEFQFPVDGVPVARLRALCAAYGFANVVPVTLDRTPLNGMLGGFVDLVFAWDGRYHVLDYKTNWLGPGLGAYAGMALDDAMASHHYPLQALIYTVAMHRYLRQRLRDYDAARDLGESWYLFVRAIGLAPGHGVWRRHWPPALIEALDDAFAGMERVA